MTERKSSTSHGCTFRQRIQYDRTTEESPSIAAATALAQYHGEDVAETDTRLYDYIDPDALDALFAETERGCSRQSGTVEFTVEEVTVAVRPDSIEVYRTE
ncbi:HalOD1 output domain-containing protein [Natronorubrum sulfidifaciens]|uniref:Halobacterial output domain-containing protein n=1 Tax=Natronorubrum sulfidifaciens JCM 14089 TaxID=1230460 RepID=L9WDU7_9EURY|nr:HalOD1 output domain-containing protein [Natronorubrum sulfidifaciens]ELY47639.1 hypothetical protein C495_05257 [Natronorubrum sulfidifaciens JCM 14089]